MLKLFNKNIKFEVIKKEYEMSQVVNNLSVCTPMPYEIITSDEKYGIIYQNIKNKKSITKLLLIDFNKYIRGSLKVICLKLQRYF